MIGSPPSGGSSAAATAGGEYRQRRPERRVERAQRIESEPAFSASAGSTRAASRAGAQPPATAAQTPSTKNAIVHPGSIDSRARVPAKKPLPRSPPSAAQRQRGQADPERQTERGCR